MNKRNRLKIRITYREILLFFAAGCIIVPNGLLTLIPGMNVLYNIGQLVVLFILVFVLINHHLDYLKSDVATFVFILFLFATVLVAIFHGMELRIWYREFFPLILVILIIKTNIDNLDDVIIVFYFVFEVWIYINLLTMILFPSGLFYNVANNSNLCWIFGYKSSFQYYILPGITFGWINHSYRKQHIRFFLLCITCAYQAFMSHNTMLLVGLLVYYVFIFFLIHERFYNIWIFYVIDIFANFTLVFGTSKFAASKLGRLFFSITNKQSTISSRETIIWANTLLKIRSNYIFGNGFLTSEERVAMYNGYKPAVHSHNQLLEIMFIGGLFLMVFYIIMHIYIGKKLSQSKNALTTKHIATSLFVLYLMMSVEVYTTRFSAGIWMIIVSSAYTKLMDIQLKRRDDYVTNGVIEYI